MNYFALSVKPNASRIYKISYLAADRFHLTLLLSLNVKQE